MRARDAVIWQDSGTFTEDRLGTWQGRGQRQRCGGICGLIGMPGKGRFRTELIKLNGDGKI